MARLIRLDATGHTELGTWRADDAASHHEVAGIFRRELERGMIASVSRGGATAEVTRELPLDAELVVLRRPIAGG